MLIEGTSKTRSHHSEGSGKKSKKSRKRQADFDTDIENMETLATITFSDEAQPIAPVKTKRKKVKVLEDVPQQKHGSIKKTQDNGEQRSAKQKKHVNFNLESSNMSSDREERESVEEYPHEDPMFVQGNGMKEERELKTSSDTNWVQKASWKSLVGEIGRVSFSLGSIVGDNSCALSSTRLLNTCMDGLSSDTVSSAIEGSSAAPIFEFSSPSNGHSSLPHAKNTPKLVKKYESDFETRKHQSVRTPVVENVLKSDPQKVEQGTKRVLDLQNLVQNEQQKGAEVCKFMRSENYEQEWLEAKRAVKDIFKRTRKDALKSMKMFHKKHN